MAIKIINYTNLETTHLSLPLLNGETSISGDSEIFVQNKHVTNQPVVWPVINGKFKALVPLNPGENKIFFSHRNYTQNLTLIYEPLKLKRFVRLVYIRCKDDSGLFQAPSGETNSIDSACNRITLGAQMLQTFTADKLKEHGLERKTFRLEEQENQVVCHVFTSSLSLKQALKLTDVELWSHFAVELMNSNLRVGNDCKFLAFLSFTHYCNNTNFPPQNYQEMIQMTKGQVALGGGGLALFGSGCLHTWPQELREVPWRFGDKRQIDKMKFMDDSANRGWHWACYATCLGATLHELGHTFDLGHTAGGIMGRGFDDIHKYFIIDMFYLDHSFQKEHNPHYQLSAAQNQTVSLSLASPVSWIPNLEESLNAVKQTNLESSYNNPPTTSLNNNREETNLNEIPWRTPNPPERYVDDPKFAVSIGRAYWEKSNALILYYHRWFNDVCSDENTASLKGTKLSSKHGLRVVEFRDTEGTSFHHIDFLEGEGVKEIDISMCNLKDHLSKIIPEVFVIAEDSSGALLKSKIKLADLV